jgi:hypothetical protein
MWKYLLACLMVMHGLAHVTGIIGAFGSGSQAFEDQPWIFSQGITAQGAVGKAWSLVWLVALAGLGAAGVGLLSGQDWWPTLAVAAAIASFVAIVPWVRVVPPGAWAGALLDLAIVAVLASPWADRFVEALA